MLIQSDGGMADTLVSSFGRGRVSIAIYPLLPFSLSLSPRHLICTKQRVRAKQNTRPEMVAANRNATAYLQITTIAAFAEHRDHWAATAWRCTKRLSNLRKFGRKRQRINLALQGARRAACNAAFFFEIPGTSQHPMWMREFVACDSITQPNAESLVNENRPIANRPETRQPRSPA